MVMVIASHSSKKNSIGGVDSQAPVGPAGPAGDILFGEGSDLPPLTCIRGYESRSNVGVVRHERKARVFYVKCRDGILVAHGRGLVVRWFTLTESDYAIGMGFDYGVAVDAFNHKLRRDYGRDVWFMWVEHLQGDKQRRNRHYLECGTEKLDLDSLNEFWLKVYGSYVSFPKDRRTGKSTMVIGNASECASYLAEYVAGEGFQRARFSYNWVFPGWFDYSRWVKRSHGRYPDVIELVKLSGISPAERSCVPEFREWLLSRQGVVKQRLADKVLGKSRQELEWLAAYYKRHGRKMRKLKLSEV
jgi:hypothetical protein